MASFSKGLLQDQFRWGYISRIGQGRAGLGVVIRDWRGNVVASLSEQGPLPFSLDIVEAMAATREISFAHEHSIKPVILEGDSESMINALNSVEDSLSSFGSHYYFG